ncbi:MAG: hypothetical protein M0C28_11175 [Candidatus Moduliflexus flocculans]|nr:hypothetical protein [Candidatus Moduliflexus flocculans]
MDFAAALPLNTANGSLAVPTRADSPVRDLSMYAWLYSSLAPNSSRPFSPTFEMTIGGPSHAERSADGNRWDYEMNRIAPTGVTSPERGVWLR